ncbi:WRAP73 [Symbiodinium sp. CCMP2456]|nr:WRAP73 [Symbiodinium sp. CCMP2456]
MSRSAALCFDDTLPSTRELRFASTEDVSALRTHLCCLSARLLFLLAHGLLVVSIAASLETIEAGHANWWLIFLPVWIGNAFCLLLLTFSWCASCPYIKRCLAERTPRLNNHPSILTEILPEIVLTIPGLTFVVLAICAEHSFCAYLMSVQQGQPQSTTSCAVLFSMIALLAVCQGALFRDNSVLWLSLGIGLFVSTIAFAVCEGDCPAPGKAVVVMPFWLSVLFLLLASVWRMRSYAHVLQQDELMLLRVEAVLLALLALCLLSVLAKTWQAKLGQAEVDGCFTGAILCMLAFPRGQLCVWEAKRGQLVDRTFWQQAVTPPLASLEVMEETGPTPTVLGATDSEVLPELPPGGTLACADELATSTGLVLSALTALVTAEPRAGEEELHHDRIISCRFLLSMFALDSLSWATGKIFQYEALLMAEELGWCYLLISFVTTTAEIVVEFIASALTPLIHARVEGRRSSRSLACLATKAYAGSNLIALVVYPALGAMIHLAGMKDTVMVCILVVVRTLQYSFCNQVGDQALEMSRPYWLRSFRGTWLCLLGRCPGLLGLRREASPESVSYYVTLLRFAIMFALGSAYVVVHKNDMLRCWATRWSLAALCLIVNAATSLILLRMSAECNSFNFLHHRLILNTRPQMSSNAMYVALLLGNSRGPPPPQALSRGIVDAAEVDIGGESQGLAEVVIAFGAPPQALDALQSLGPGIGSWVLCQTAEAALATRARSSLKVRRCQSGLLQVSDRCCS